MDNFEQMDGSNQQTYPIQKHKKKKPFAFVMDIVWAMGILQ